MLQYELPIGPSIGAALTTLKRSLALYPCRVGDTRFISSAVGTEL